MVKKDSPIAKEYEDVAAMVDVGLSQKIADHGFDAFVPSDAPEDGITKKILEFDEATAQLGLGKLGSRLKKFVEACDLQHPNMRGLLASALDSSSDFSQRACEALEHARFAKENNLKKVIKLISNALNHQSEYKEFSKFFQFPPVRFIKDPKERAKRRHQKSWKSIDLRNIFRSGEDGWNSFSKTFRIYPRLSNFYEKDLEQSKAKMDKLQKQGLSSLAKVFKAQIDKVAQLKQEQHCGFYRVPLTHIALSLARMLDFDYKDGYSQILVPASHYKGHDFLVDGNEADEYWDRPLKKMGKLARNSNSFIYSPRTYPIHQFDVKSNRVEKILSQLESFHDMADRPVFDHFWVVCPGIEYPNSPLEGSWCIKTEGSVKKFSTQDQAFVALDKEMTRAGAMNPVLIGEMNGKCYFISYYND